MAKTAQSERIQATISNLMQAGAKPKRVLKETKKPLRKEPAMAGLARTPFATELSQTRSKKKDR